MFTIKSEKNFIEYITSALDAEVVEKSHKNVPYHRAINYLKYWSKTINKILIAYEVKLNKLHSKFPDFLIMFKGKRLRVEIKDRETEQTIAKEINSIDNFKDDEFWYILSEHHDKNKVLSYATKKDVRIKVMYLNQNLLDKMHKFFQ